VRSRLHRTVGLLAPLLLTAACCVCLKTHRQRGNATLSSPTPGYDFGKVLVGAVAVSYADVLWMNSGSECLVLEMLQTQPSPPFFAFHQYTSRDFLQKTLRPNYYSTSPYLSFEPTAEGTFSGLATVEVSERCSNGAPYVPAGGSLQLSGTAVLRYSAVYGNPTPVEPGSLRLEWDGSSAGGYFELGSTPTGATATAKSMTLWNDSARAREVAVRSSLSVVEIRPAQMTVPANGSATFEVRFRPLQATHYLGVIEAAEKRTQTYSLWQYVGVSVRGDGRGP
jgi:hypothetical protein